MNRKPRKTKRDECLDLSLRACRELLIAASRGAQTPEVSRAIVLARYALAMRP